MTIFFLAFGASIVFRLLLAIKPRRKTPRTMPVYAPVVSPADIARRQKERERAAREAERAEAKRQREEERERKAVANRQQAEADKVFLVEQIDKLYTMLWEADAELTAARRTCQHDAEANKAGAVVADKITAKHRAERDKLEKKVMQLERNIHSYEAKLNKAQQIAQN